MHWGQALGTLRPQDTSALNYSAELSGHFGTDLYETLWHHYTLMDFVQFVAGKHTKKSTYQQSIRRWQSSGSRPSGRAMPVCVLSLQHSRVMFCTTLLSFFPL